MFARADYATAEHRAMMDGVALHELKRRFGLLQYEWPEILEFLRLASERREARSTGRLTSGN